jgi:uncharacterized protein (DUF302 family)
MGLFTRRMLQQVTKGDGSQIFMTLQLAKILNIIKKLTLQTTYIIYTCKGVNMS